MAGFLFYGSLAEKKHVFVGKGCRHMNVQNTEKCFFVFILREPEQRETLSLLHVHCGHALIYGWALHYTASMAEQDAHCQNEKETRKKRHNTNTNLFIGILFDRSSQTCWVVEVKHVIQHFECCNCDGNLHYFLFTLITLNKIQCALQKSALCRSLARRKQLQK